MKFLRLILKFLPYLAIILTGTLMLGLFSLKIKQKITDLNDQKNFKRFIYDNMNQNIYGFWNKEIETSQNMLE